MSKRKPEKISPNNREIYAQDEWWGHGYNQAISDYNEWLESKLGEELVKKIKLIFKRAKIFDEEADDTFMSLEIVDSLRKHLGVKDE